MVINLLTRAKKGNLKKQKTATFHEVTVFTKYFQEQLSELIYQAAKVQLFLQRASQYSNLL